MEPKTIFFPIFILLALFFTVFLFYFVYGIMRTKKGILRSKMFLNADPIIKSFYQLFMGASLSYILLLIYYLNQEYMELFILAEVILGLSLIGFAYLIIPLFTYKKLR